MQRELVSALLCRDGQRTVPDTLSAVLPFFHMYRIFLRRVLVERERALASAGRRAGPYLDALPTQNTTEVC
jgi:hypothetical protein